jgi:hypothetical protein
MEKYRQDENDQFLALRLGWLRQDMARSSYSVSWTSGWTFLPLVELLECEELYMPSIHYVLPLYRPIPINIQQVYSISYSIHCLTHPVIRGPEYPGFNILMSAAAGNGDTEGAEGVLVRCLAGYAGSC